MVGIGGEGSIKGRNASLGLWEEEASGLQLRPLQAQGPRVEQGWKSGAQRKERKKHGKGEWTGRKEGKEEEETEGERHGKLRGQRERQKVKEARPRL